MRHVATGAIITSAALAVPDAIVPLGGKFLLVICTTVLSSLVSHFMGEFWKARARRKAKESEK